MAKTSEIRDRLIEALEASAPSHGIDIVDVEVSGSAKASIVRVRIDRLDPAKDPITLEDVAAQNAWIDKIIEAEDPFPGSYILEVSSPGLDRPLRRPQDFQRYVGETVQVKLRGHEGRRNFTGELAGFEDGQILLECDDVQEHLPLGEVQSAHIKPRF